ncbi:MAG: thiolase family protein, partial [Comamonadaceae bacterium]
MQDIYIVGVGMTHFGRHLDLTEKQLTSQAVEEALRDAACDSKAVGAAFFGNCGQGYMRGQHMIRGQVALLPLGIQGVPIVNVENACATASTAFHMAVNYLRGGNADLALAVGTEKMYSTDRAKMFGVFDSGWDLELVEETHNALVAMGKGVDPPEASMSPKSYSPFMDVYAGFARRYISRFGITQRQLACIAAKNHMHSVDNPRSQFRMPMTADEVMAAQPITYPLTVSMCAPVSDGSAAANICNEKALAGYGFDRRRAVRVVVSGRRSASTRDGVGADKHITRLADTAGGEIA